MLFNIETIEQLRGNAKTKLKTLLPNDVMSVCQWAPITIFTSSVQTR